MNKCSAIVTRNVTDKDYTQIMEIRREHFYDSPFNSKYWEGGIQTLLSEEEIRRSHLCDPSSNFLLLKKNEDVVGYARYSLNIEKSKSDGVSKLHIFSCKKQLLGKEIEIVDNGILKKVKAGKFLLTKVIENCSILSSELISEICVFPYPNLPSLILHKREGFVSQSNSLTSVNRGQVTLNFIVLSKHLS